MSSPHDTRTEIEQAREEDGPGPDGEEAAGEVEAEEATDEAEGDGGEETDGDEAEETEGDEGHEDGPRTEGHRLTALTVTMVTVDCEDPHELAGFWQRAMGAETAHESEDFVVLTGEPRLAFQRVEQPSAGKNRLHLDLAGTDRTTEVARLVELGAEVVRNHDVDGFAWTVMRDPAGNEFCVADAED
ncbi:VOC family protein [uncultured Ornithinimicrobium sp.]|uniref:VOC family protein n=1 Tax=uncultured Ornithinimicrobium sp. TaxID=259307 RepID=UPI0025938AA0|nr:VOC family protein [uncultured Ornithinimicrobium sp.]